jgi:hypothetical protein
MSLRHHIPAFVGAFFLGLVLGAWLGWVLYGIYGANP